MGDCSATWEKINIWFYIPDVYRTMASELMGLVGDSTNVLINEHEAILISIKNILHLYS